jgi:hypothetical protein
MPDLFAARDSMDFFDPLLFGLDFLAFARVEVVFFFAEDGFERLFVREAADWERDFFGAMIFVSPLDDETGPPNRRPLSFSNFSANAERVSAISW